VPGQWTGIKLNQTQSNRLKLPGKIKMAHPDWSAAVCKAPAAARGKAVRHQAYSSRLVLRSGCGWSRFAGHSRAPGSVRGCAQTKTGGWNSLYSQRFWGILQILNFSESAQVYGKTYGS
jgi:hypothetical protein